MKPKFILIVIALLAIVTGAKAAVTINSTNFPDETFRSYVKQYIDANKNVRLDDDEITKTTFIDVSTSDVANLEGIGFFTELTILYCEGCLLTTLDVSNNTKLETLYCQYNKLTSLNVSGCSALQFLNCSANRLKALDVSGCTSLEELYCDGNSIKGYGMTRLVVSLPMNVTVKEHKLYTLSKNTEGNAITNDQLTVAKLLGWTVYRGSEKLEARKGDVNEDGTVDVADISTVIDIMAGKQVVDETAYACCPNESHPHWIDLGLPSGTQWLCCNEGASKPEEYGGYYTFDEAQAYNPPTIDQIKEFINYCTSEWTTLNGVNGRKFTGPNGGTIFLPAAGMLVDDELWGDDSAAYFWSSTPYSDDFSDNGAYRFYINGSTTNYVVWDYVYYRFTGFSVRPVR